jgi:hypothetical protein
MRCYGSNFRLRIGWLFAIFLFAGLGASRASAQVAVTTYHYDNNRTGWNSQETVLQPTNVNKTLFGQLYSVPLDEQVDSQPLFMPNVNITAGSFQGLHDVLFVVTENNSVYAIDSHVGTVLLRVNFGKPVALPMGCKQNGPNVGAMATPVIDATSNTMYEIFYTNKNSVLSYTIHALDLGSLADKVRPQTVAASHTLQDGTTFSFNATYQRQRSALLLANGKVYAGFASFCDLGGNLSRGWLLGWNTGSLTPLGANLIFDTLTTSPFGKWLSSIWMSGSAPAVDDSGNILVVTGNSDPTTYNGVTDIQESAVKLTPDLLSVLDLFTPSDQPQLDETDLDFGAGGVLLLPDQAGSIPHLALGAGRDGNMYLMNEDNLGGFSSTQNNVLGTYVIGSCFCGESYFMDRGGPRVVSSGGKTAMLWRLSTSPTPSLSLISTSATVGLGQTTGFMTTVSSNGTSNPIIWAVSRPIQTNTQIFLEAFNPDAAGTTLKLLYQGVAGSWPNGGNANIVPVVANGQVYVASNKALRVFGLLPGEKQP